MKLPPLPEPNGYDDRHTEEQLQAVQIAAARAALEEAAKVCDEWEKKNWVYINGAICCGKDIRAITIEGET